jgi:hypothetical protein
MRLNINTRDGKSVEATPQHSMMFADDGSCHLEWKLAGVDPESIESVAFGLAH